MGRLTRAAALLAGALVWISVACARPGAGDTPTPSADTQEVCRGASIPPGWLMMNSSYDRYRCPQPEGQGDNVVTIWRYEDKPVGTEQQVCERSPTPPGWEASNHRWDPTRCRTGQGVERTNVKTIKRVS